MPKLSTFYSGDKVRLLNGRIGTVIRKYPQNKYYYEIDTYNDEGNKVHLVIFVLDMRKLKTTKYFHNGRYRKENLK